MNAVSFKLKMRWVIGLFLDTWIGGKTAHEI